jgi:hypothetical protein
MAFSIEDPHVVSLATTLTRSPSRQGGGPSPITFPYHALLRALA